MSDINAVRTNPIYKQAVTDLLIIDDVAGYIDKSSKYVAGYEPASFAPATVKKLVANFRSLGVSAQTEAELTKSNADLQAIKDALIAKLSTAEKNTYNAKQKLLGHPAKKEDLSGVIRTLPSSSNKQAIIDLLIIDDIAGYMSSGNRFVPGYEPASFAPKVMKKVNPNFSSLGVSAQTEAELTKSNADLAAIKNGLLAKLDSNAKQVYYELRIGLDKPESQSDLLIQLCKLGRKDPLCPKSSTDNLATLRKVRDVWGVYLRGPQDEVTGQSGAGMLGGSGLTTTSPALQGIFPAFGVEAGFNPQIAGPNPVAKRTKNSVVQWNLNAGITARRLITSGTDTHGVSLKTGTSLSFPYWRYIQPFGSIGYQFNFQQYEDPNVFYADGTDHQLSVKGGALFDVSKYFAFSLFGAHQYNWFDHSFNNVIRDGYEMSGNEQLDSGGLEALVRLNQRSKWAPDIKINFEGGAGSLNVPIGLSVGGNDVLNSEGVVDQLKFSGSLTLLWKRLSVLGGVTVRDIDGGWSHEHRGWFGGGYKWDSGWHLRGTLNFYELDPANPVSGAFANILFTPGGSKWVQPFTIQAMFGNHGGGGSIGVDLYKFWEAAATK